MDENYLKEKANCLRNEMNHLWGAMFITGGGAIGFICIEEKNMLIYTFIVLGILFSILFLNAYMLRRHDISKILLTIKQQERKNNETYSRHNM